MWLPWDAALAMAVAALLLGTALRQAGHAGRASHAHREGHPDRRALASAMLVEAALVLALYALWQRAGELSVMDTSGALRRGRWIADLQRRLHVPSEATLQHPLLGHPLLLQAANVYYAVVHVPAMIAFLVWSFVRDRAAYRRWRTATAVTTAACLAVQLVPVAPPRMFPDLGFVDTALRYHQSVYTALGRGTAGQLAAMPSVHVAWALIVAAGVATIARRRRWRTLGWAHALCTVLVVAVTANHWWADSAVAAALLAGWVGLGALTAGVDARRSAAAHPR